MRKHHAMNIHEWIKLHDNLYWFHAVPCNLPFPDLYQVTVEGTKSGLFSPNAMATGPQWRVEWKDHAYTWLKEYVTNKNMHSIESTSNRMHLICQKVLSVHISRMMRYREKPDISSSWRLSHWSSVLISEMCLLVHTNCWCQLYQEVSSWHKEPPNDFLYMHWPIFGTISCRPGAELWFVKHRLVHCLQQIAIKKELWQNSAACLWKCNVIQCYFQMYIARWKCWSCNIKCNSVKHAPPATCETMNRWNRGIWIIASTRTGHHHPLLPLRGRSDHTKNHVHSWHAKPSRHTQQAQKQGSQTLRHSHDSTCQRAFRVEWRQALEVILG